jgi:hypothetical protein
MPEIPGCPFFARFLAFGIELAHNPGSNQCALITTAHSPCVMEVAHQIPSWRTCIRNPANNGSYIDPIGRITQIETGDSLLIEVPAGPLTIVPDTPETVAEKARSAREVVDAFHRITRETPSERVGRMTRANPAGLVNIKQER